MEGEGMDHGFSVPTNENPYFFLSYELMDALIEWILKGGNRISTVECCSDTPTVGTEERFDSIYRDLFRPPTREAVEAQPTRSLIEIPECTGPSTFTWPPKEKMVADYLECVYRQVCTMEERARSTDLVLDDQIHLRKTELRLLRRFLRRFGRRDDTQAIITKILGWIREKGCTGPLPALHADVCEEDIPRWHRLVSELGAELQEFNFEIARWCQRLLRGSLEYKPSGDYEILRCLDDAQENLKDLVNYQAGKFVPLKEQIEAFEEKLLLLRNLWELAVNCMSSKDLEESTASVDTWAQQAACLTFLCWVKEADGETADEMNDFLSDVLQKFKPCASASYFLILKAIKLPGSRTHRWDLEMTVIRFVQLFVSNLGADSSNEVQVLRDGLIFLLAFVSDPPKNRGEADSICSQANVLFREDAYLLLPFDAMKKDFPKQMALLSDFTQKIQSLIVKIRQLFCEFSDSSPYNFPRIIGQGFLAFLIRNLTKFKMTLCTGSWWVSFVFRRILLEELESLRPYFTEFLELQKERKELNDTWLQLIDTLYLTEHALHLSSVLDCPFWYCMPYLSHVLDRIKAVKTKLSKIKEFGHYNAGVFPCLASGISILQERAWTSEAKAVVVGFEEKANIIINKLTRGHESLDIISVVGMAGVGKTTLARKVYGSSSVKCHFITFAFCTVSQGLNTRKLLLDILSNITVTDDNISSMTNDDLAHKIWKCLSSRRYLVVMDDIWDIRAWNGVKSSFPDDKNGSRVMFTTRFQNVAMEAKINCGPYCLDFLSEDLSWELLQKKVFCNGISPPNYSQVGKLIAKRCHGLPLAIVVIAGLLAGTERSLSWWVEVAERVDFYLSEKGFMEIFELSYKHLPEYLKPCLLYFGAFPEDMSVPVKSLILLWIAEGFVQESDTKSFEDVAKEYLCDLLDRSLIIAIGRSSNGGTKTVGVHDLIYDFCRTKARTENFFQLGRGILAPSSSDPLLHNHYRVCMQMVGNITFGAPQSFPSMRSLICFQRENERFDTLSIVGKFSLVQVLYLENMWLEEYDLKQLSLLVHLRHIVAAVNHLVSIPPSMFDLRNLETFVLRTMGKDEKLLPEAIWNLEWLRHVDVSRCKLNLLDSWWYRQLHNVKSFSSPTLSTGKDLEVLLQRLPAVRKLSCRFDKSYDSVDKQIEILNFGGLESLNMAYIGDRSPYVINFPSTLKKLKLVGFKLPWTAILNISKLHCLEVLKLLWNSFVGPRWETKDVEFSSLKYLKLNGLNLVHWTASSDSFPYLEQLLIIGCEDLVEIPACFGEISSLRRFEVHECRKAGSSATEIMNEQMELGNMSLEVEIYKSF